MHVLFKNPGFQYSVDSIMEFQSNGQGEWWREPLFAVYPHIDRQRFDVLTLPQRKTYLRDALHAVYTDEEQQLSEKAVKYNERWNVYRSQIEEAFSDAFNCDCVHKFNDITGNITLNPICPRYIETRTFDVFYLNSERGALGMALHELIHFIWFDVWRAHFDDSAAQYETPHMKWVFSEMVVDPIMRKDGRLSEINPYFADGCAYAYFYGMKVDGAPILDTLYSLYCCSGITDFMEQGYAYCLKYEDEIRTQMET